MMPEVKTRKTEYLLGKDSMDMLHFE